MSQCPDCLMILILSADTVPMTVDGCNWNPVLQQIVRHAPVGKKPSHESIRQPIWRNGSPEPF